MQLLTVVCTINILHLIAFCASDKHTYGEHQAYFSHRMYDRTLIEDYNDVPRNYIIIYKYFGSYFKPIASIEIDVNVRSSGYIHEKTESFELAHRLGTRTRQVFNSKIYINNALNVTAILRIYGHGISLSPMIWTGRDQATKSLTFIYAKNARPSANANIFAQNSIGKRRKGDELINFQSRNVTNLSRFPSRSFEYSGVEYITYVAFFFNSRTAMVMVNTSYVGENEFSAVVYDMNTDHFVANMTVYGLKTNRPRGFEGVI